MPFSSNHHLGETGRARLPLLYEVTTVTVPDGCPTIVSLSSHNLVLRLSRHETLHSLHHITHFNSFVPAAAVPRNETLGKRGSEISYLASAEAWTRTLIPTPTNLLLICRDMSMRTILSPGVSHSEYRDYAGKLRHIKQAISSCLGLMFIFPGDRLNWEGIQQNIHFSGFSFRVAVQTTH